MMSGGLDSTAIAAMARAERGPNGLPVDLEAHTVVFDRIVRDEERHYSTIAAQALGIPVHHHPFDDYGFPAPEPEPAGYPPEPRLLLDWSRLIAVYRPAAASARVVLKGEGADTLLIATAAAPQRLLDQRRYGALLRAYLWLIWRRRQLPYFGVRTMLRQAFGHPPPLLAQPFPAWLQPPLVEQLRIRERWLGEAALEHDRPGDDLVTAYWPWIFESTDPVTLQLPAEMRYPFFDLRLVRWLLRVPQVPWCMEKSLLRIAMADRLPAPIIRRRKAPVAGNPWRSLVPPARDRWWEPFMTPAPELDRFVDLDVARRTLETVLPAAQDRNAHGDIDLLRSTLRPLSLNLWLTRVARGNLLSGSRQPR
jgi:asparagine synthase (glutamine-hydrolysing)